ncbi:LysR family transcriptional regulator [Mixta calida]|uniref:LysR family transcriptional regulator n=1 Tax=Mixta calida TaxID=665913 RepID=A0ABM6S132_9GAMM|nr:LysR family transcriptional regulator [Mixta calida]AIX73984.1 LysR family transcriptional regulator [Pantoea sp. PSNIH2]POU42126.1 LysR family transcriptional regulator [Pantoea sp. PSNIH5]POU61083.1 LysR family transcriptional regulator [Pantoea sp. PSNIH4]POY66166.1 LysR family transcriptional regulator [Pantoea sp. PSNIH3]HCW47488.1 LysR family transcriptional regulator [Erwiniaceae bacterium]
MRADFNDYYWFAQVISHGGFAAASRALGVPKSRLSRRIFALEERLGMRLIERTSRRFRMTEVGEAFYERCRILLLDAEQAEAVVAEAKAEPHGRVRFSCPTGLVEVIQPHLPAFLTRYPHVKLQIIALDRPVDLIHERIDIALRVRTELTSDADLIMRTLGVSHRILVASPTLAARLSDDIDTLNQWPTLGTSDEPGELTWPLENHQGERRLIKHEPRMSCGDFLAVRAAAVSGLGIALLPDHSCTAQLNSGELVQVFRPWRGQAGIVHLVFTTRRGLPPAVRAFIDHLAATFPRI